MRERKTNRFFKNRAFRFGTQILFFAIVSFIAINHYLEEIGNSLSFISSDSLHAFCPYGGVEAFFAWLNYDVLIKKIHTSSFVILGIVLSTAILFGPVFCSFACPLGSIQEWIGKIGKRIFRKKYNHFIPAKFDKILRYLRYGVLIFVVYLTTNSLRLIFLEVDPYYALFNFWSSEETIGGIIVLIIILISSLFVERPWCKYACPFGALLGLTNFIRIFKIRRNSATCISCGKCSKECPMNIDVQNIKTIYDHQCISCMECTSEVSCPVSNTVVMKASKKFKMEDES